MEQGGAWSDASTAQGTGHPGTRRSTAAGKAPPWALSGVCPENTWFQMPPLGPRGTLSLFKHRVSGTVMASWEADAPVQRKKVLCTALQSRCSCLCGH